MINKQFVVRIEMLIICLFFAGSLFALSYPTSSYTEKSEFIQTDSTEEAQYLFAEQTMLGMDDDQPDPGAVPIGDEIPLIASVLMYTGFVLLKKKRNKR